MHGISKPTFCVVALTLLLGANAAAGRVKSEPGVYDVAVRTIRIASRRLHVTYVKPVTPRHTKYLIVFTTGDGGWHGVSNEVLEHLAAQGYRIAGLSAPEVLRPLKRARRKMSAQEAAELLGAAFTRLREDFAVAASARLIVVGFSRGATFVAFTAVHPDLQADLAGAIAIGLTRQADYIASIAPSASGSRVQPDKRRRGLIYPALKLYAHVPVAVIQSTGDRYVSAAESRDLLGPDTATRRLYTVQARNHRFGGGREQLIEDLDAALRWIEQR